MEQLYHKCGNEVYLVDSGCQIGGVVLTATGRPTSLGQQQNSRQGYWPLAQYVNRVESGESVRVLRNGKPIADIVPVLADLPSWKHRKAQPLVLDGVSVSRMILEERETGV